jgi:hypothetical protein
MNKHFPSAMFSSAAAFTLKIGGHIFGTGEWRPRLAQVKNNQRLVCTKFMKNCITCKILVARCLLSNALLD